MTSVTARAAPTIHRGGLAPWQRRRAAELLASHLDGSIRLATLARECGLSVSHFARSFRQSFGTSAHRYLMRQRVEKSKELLTRSHRPLSEVALDAGFADQAAFSRTFKAMVGSSPGQWRRQAEHLGGLAVPPESRSTRSTKLISWRLPPAP